MTSFITLYLREVRRFTKLWMDTLISPLASTVLFLAVFGIVMSGREVTGIPYLTFIYTGLLAMNVVTASFSNPSFALVIAKNLGTIIDLQLAPMRAWQIGLAYGLAATTRSVTILLITLAVTAWWIPSFTILHPFLLAGAIILSGVQFGMLGTIFGIWAKGFEALPFITSFILQPMVFLGGVFYPISQLPGIWATVSEWNPLHHNINLVRYAFTGYSDVSPVTSSLVLVLSLLPLAIVMHIAMRRHLQQ